MPNKPMEKNDLFWKTAREWLEKRVEEIDKHYKGAKAPLLWKKLFEKEAYNKKLSSMKKIKKGLPSASLVNEGYTAKDAEDNLTKSKDLLSRQNRRRFIYQVNLIENFYKGKFKDYCEKNQIESDSKVGEDHFINFLNKDTHNHHLTRMLGLTLQEVYNKILPKIGEGELYPQDCPVERLHAANYKLNVIPPSIDESNKKPSDPQLNFLDEQGENTNKFKP